MKLALLIFLLPLSSQAAFLCDGRTLITSNGALYNFPSDQHCQEALAKASNGFVCDGRKLITLGGGTQNFPSDSACEAAVQNSK